MISAGSGVPGFRGSGVPDERVAATLVFGALLIGSFYAYPRWSAAAKHFVAGAGWGALGIALATAVVCTTVAALIARESEY